MFSIARADGLGDNFLAKPLGILRACQQFSVTALPLPMSTKFFTNEEGRTLLEKIAGIFAHKNIHFFDVLVGQTTKPKNEA